MIKKAALFCEQDLIDACNERLAKDGLTLDQAIEQDIKSFGDDELVIKEYQKWIGRGIATPDNAQDFIEEKHYSYNVFNIIAERFGWDMRLRGK